MEVQHAREIIIEGRIRARKFVRGIILISNALYCPPSQREGDHARLVVLCSELVEESERSESNQAWWLASP